MILNNNDINECKLRKETQFTVNFQICSFFAEGERMASCYLCTHFLAPLFRHSATYRNLPHQADLLRISFLSSVLSRVSESFGIVNLEFDQIILVFLLAPCEICERYKCVT